MRLEDRTSVALATYNGETYLPAQLASIASQTRRPDEIVVGDDQSTDNTIAILQRFADETKIPVRIVRNDRRLGSTGNFAAILSRCQGDVILLSDQDDVWMPNRVERSLSELDARPDMGFVFADASLISAGGTSLPGSLWDSYFPKADQARFRRGLGWQSLLRFNMVTGATMAIRREAALEALPIPPGWIHDAWLAIFIAFRHGGWPIEEKLISYRCHEAQQIGVTERTIPEILRRIRNQGADFYRAEAANFIALSRRLGDTDAGYQAAYKAEVLTGRAALRESLLAAIISIPAAFILGDYVRYGHGKKQVIDDLLGAVIGIFDRLNYPRRRSRCVARK